MFLALVGDAVLGKPPPCTTFSTPDGTELNETEAFLSIRLFLSLPRAIR